MLCGRQCAAVARSLCVRKGSPSHSEFSEVDQYSGCNNIAVFSCVATRWCTVLDDNWLCEATGKKPRVGLSEECSIMCSVLSVFCVQYCRVTKPYSHGKEVHIILSFLWTTASFLKNCFVFQSELVTDSHVREVMTLECRSDVSL